MIRPKLRAKYIPMAHQFRFGADRGFTGTMDEMNRMIALGLDVGVNGCSMKTEENLEEKG
jgi:hypothetical protein